MEKHLQETKILNYSNKEIIKLVNLKKWNDLKDSEKVKAIYNYVKDEILFGYNTSDNIKASKVLKDGYGQCNTKAILFMALLRKCGIPCRIHAFLINKELQKGAMKGLIYNASPKEILHSYVEVYLDNKWYDLEGLILDDKYLKSLQKLFAANSDGSFIGYGVATDNFINPQVYFNNCNTYIQNKGITKDLGIYDSPDDMYKDYKQQINIIKKIIFRFIGRKLMNKNVKKIRNQKVN